jgi:hypothetical protein
MTTTLPDPGFSTDEVLTQAQSNVTGFGLALLRYALDHGDSPPKPLPGGSVPCSPRDGRSCVDRGHGWSPG